MVFWGADSATANHRDNSGIVSGGRTGVVETDAGGGLDLTITEHFAAACLSEKHSIAKTCCATR